MERFNRILHKEFDKLLKELRELNLSSDFNNKVIETRNNVVQLYSKAVSELKAKKKFNLDIDFLNADIRRIDLTKLDSPYWLEGEIKDERPPGPTNQEINELRKKINRLFVEFRIKINNSLIESKNFGTSIHSIMNHLEILILEEVKKTFVLPNENILFSKALYDRNPHKPLDYFQNTPCEICGENRCVDVCHIIPAEFGGPKSAQNTIYLCPTHHRLFDRMMLSKKEWEKINWGKAGKASANFAFHVILPKMQKFWSKLENEIFQRNSISITQMSEIDKAYRATVESVLKGEKKLTVNELVEKTDINKSTCLKLVSELIKENKIEIVKEGAAVYYMYNK